jgi:hypothetical protein
MSTISLPEARRLLAKVSAELGRAEAAEASGDSPAVGDAARQAGQAAANLGRQLAALAAELAPPPHQWGASLNLPGPGHHDVPAFPR